MEQKSYLNSFNYLDKETEIYNYERFILIRFFKLNSFCHKNGFSV